MSVRNIDADLALTKLNDLFHLHRYDDCVVFLNRLNHLTLKQIVAQLPVDMYLSRLPYTIEIFEAIYAKVFIVEPDHFPYRALHPEKLVDKMVAYFSLLSSENKLEPVDGAKMLDSFENCIRIISYVQPNLYSRLLFFKDAIDRALLKLDKELAMYNKSLASLRNKSSKSSSNNQDKENNLSLIVSRAVNAQTCESVRGELMQTIDNSQRALTRINEHIASLKSEKVYKDVELYLHEINAGEKSSRLKSMPKKSRSTSAERDKINKANDTIVTVSEETKGVKGSSGSGIGSNSAVCQNFIQHRLYLNKAMMNVIEPYLITIKLKDVLTGLYENIDLDKEILLVFTHLKKEETHLNSLEPLQPLFKRYALGFERCIQIWRKKCYGDNLLIFTDNPNNNEKKADSGDQPKNKENQTKNKRSSSSSANNLPRRHANHLNSSNLAIDRINFFNLKQKQYASPYYSNESTSINCANHCSATLDREYGILNSNSTVNYLNNIFDDLNGGVCNNGAILEDAQSNKYFSQVNINHNLHHGYYNTMPAKLRSQRKRTAMISAYCAASGQQSASTAEIDLEDELTEILRKRGVRHRPVLTKHAESQTQIDRLKNENSLVRKDFSSTANVDHNKLEEAKVAKEKFEIVNDNLNKIENEVLACEYKEEIERLNDDLKFAKDLILKFQREETILREKLKEKEDELNEKVKSYEEKLSKSRSEAESLKNENRLNKEKFNYLFTSDLIHLYSNLNNKYRIEAHDSLHSIDMNQNVKEFKLKLLFSVIVLSFRYVKLHIRDLKRRIKTLLQISERKMSNEFANNQKSQTPMTPTIIIQKPEDQKKQQSTASDQKTNGKAFVNENEITDEDESEERRKTFAFNGRWFTDNHENSVQMIESAINKYLQLVTLRNTFDISKIIEEVKDQLWNTLTDYPLKDCQELNSYINESVKTCWQLINHQPPFKLEYSSIKFDANFHERSDASNKQNDKIGHYIWPALIDASDNSCLSKGIVTT